MTTTTTTIGKEATAVSMIAFDTIFARCLPAPSFWIVVWLFGLVATGADARVAGPMLFANSNRGKVVSLASEGGDPIGDIAFVPEWNRKDSRTVICVAVLGVVAAVGLLVALVRFYCHLRTNGNHPTASKQVSVDTDCEGTTVGPTNNAMDKGDLFDDEDELS